jgi:4'-phosphopantetheinyl transferase
MYQVDIWNTTEKPLALGIDEVHLWRIDLEQPAEVLDRLGAFLSQDERARAARFHIEYLRRRYVIARSCLRTILAFYTHLRPQDLILDTLPYGKPILGGEQRSSQICFNLAHSHALALAAVTLKRRIGVDLEFQRRLADLSQVASRYFSQDEWEVFRRIEPEQQHAAFYTCWTRKEAFIKAIGDGLSYPLDQFSVAFAPGESPRILHIKSATQAASRWSMHSLQPGNGYIAALAVEGIDQHLSCWQWSNTFSG